MSKLRNIDQILQVSIQTQIFLTLRSTVHVARQSLSCVPTRCDPMICSTPGFPVLHCLLEFALTHAHWVSDGIQTSHPLSSPSPPAFSLSQHQGFFQWVDFSLQVAEELELQLKHQSFQWIFCVEDSQESSPTPQFEGINFLVLSLFYCPALTSIHDYWKNHSFDNMDLCRQSDISPFSYAV